MTATEHFIRDSIEGWWKPFVFTEGGAIDTAWMLLNPDAWRAVAKTRECGKCESGDIWQYQEKWFYHIHGLIDALCEGKTREDYLASIE